MLQGFLKQDVIIRLDQSYFGILLGNKELIKTVKQWGYIAFGDF